MKKNASLLPISDQRYVFALVVALANRMQKVGDAVFDELTWKQWFVLIGLSAFKTPPSVSELAGLFGTSHQNAKQLLLRLQKNDFVRMERDEEDQRRTLVYMEKKAKDLEQSYKEMTEQFFLSLYKGTQEEDILAARRLLLQMDQNLHGMEGDFSK